MGSRLRIAGAVGPVALAPLLALRVSTGCGATPHDVGSQDASIDAAPSCPATLAQMNDAPCAREDVQCNVLFPCGATEELVRCACKQARWRCEDPVGPLAPDTAPRCLDASADHSATCPPSIQKANTTACGEIGQLCFYEGLLCPSGITLLDYCECRRPSGRLTYVCHRLICSPWIRENAIR